MSRAPKKKAASAETSIPLIQKKIAFMAIAQERSKPWHVPSLEGARNRAQQMLTQFRGSCTRFKGREACYIDNIVRENWRKTEPKGA